MILNPSHVRWFAASLGNVLILAALIYRRARRTMPLIFYLFMFWFAIVIMQNIHQSNYYAWLILDRADMVMDFVVAFALCLYQRTGIALMLPQFLLAACTGKAMEVYYGFETMRPWFYPAVVWLGIFAVFCIAYSLFSHKIIPKENYHVRF
jgi:hypothetical protein